MKWYYIMTLTHTHVRVFMNGAKCGDLVFRNEEFTQIRKHCEHDDHSLIKEFYNEAGTRREPNIISD